MTSFPDYPPKGKGSRGGKSLNCQQCQGTETRGQPGGHQGSRSGSSPALDYGTALVASKPWSPQVPPLLCGSRALGQCPSILLGILPGSKFLSILKGEVGVQQPTQSRLSTAQSCPPFCLEPRQSHQPGGPGTMAHARPGQGGCCGGRGSVDG